MSHDLALPGIQQSRDPIERALRGARFLAAVVAKWGPCDGCDPAGEGQEIAGEILADIDTALGLHTDDVAVIERAAVALCKRHDSDWHAIAEHEPELCDTYRDDVRAVAAVLRGGP